MCAICTGRGVLQRRVGLVEGRLLVQCGGEGAAERDAKGHSDRGPQGGVQVVWTGPGCEHLQLIGILPGQLPGVVLVNKWPSILQP